MEEFNKTVRFVSFSDTDETSDLLTNANKKSGNFNLEFPNKIKCIKFIRMFNREMGLTDEHQVLLIVMDLIKNKSIWYKKPSFPSLCLRFSWGLTSFFLTGIQHDCCYYLGDLKKCCNGKPSRDGPGSEKVNHTLGLRKVVRNPNDLPSLPVIPPEVNGVSGMFWGFKYLQPQGVWKPMGLWIIPDSTQPRMVWCCPSRVLRLGGVFFLPPI